MQEPVKKPVNKLLVTCAPAGSPLAYLDVTTFELGQRLIRLEQSLRELETLQHQIHEEALVLMQIVTAAGANGVPAGTSGGDGGHGAARVASVPEAAQQLGISVSMVHKLLRERRLGHLKVGARTLITAEHIEEFLATAVQARVAGSPHHSGPEGSAKGRTGEDTGTGAGKHTASIRRLDHGGAA
ncbi:MAG: hypothetical protein JWN84_1237 [Nocardioides sp.]|nr:hypothetical protein [Nocardioides sp.]